MNPAFFAHSQESQRAIIACLRGNLHEAGAALSKSGVTRAHFVEPVATVYAVLMEMWQSGQRFNMTNVAAKVREAGQHLDLTTLLYEFAHISALPGFIDSLMRCHAGRRLHALGGALTNAAFDISADVEAVVAEARQTLDTLNSEGAKEDTSLAHHLDTAIQQLEAHETGANVVEFGLGLDEGAGPFMRGDLVLIAAATKAGKSAIAGNIVEHVACHGGRCVVFSLEMSGAQNAERMLASQARVDIRAMKLRRRLGATAQDGHELDRMTRAVAQMRNWPVDIITNRFSVSAVIAEIIRLKPALVVVDYAQLVEGIRQKGDTREREVASISGALKRAAVQANSVVMLLSQLNDDGKLRESRALGQDANCVLFLEDQDGQRIARVGAARSAPMGTEIPLDWKPQFTRFSSHV